MGSRDQASVPDTPSRCSAGVGRIKVSNNETDREPTSGAALSKCQQLRDGGSLVCQTAGLHGGGGGDVPSLCLRASQPDREEEESEVYSLSRLPQPAFRPTEVESS